jgi:hypothetical protein
MQNTFSNALSKAVSQHIELSPTRHQTLAWLAWLIMQHDLSVAAGGACGDAGANRFGAAAALPLLSACQAGWSDDGAGGGGSAGA